MTTEQSCKTTDDLEERHDKVYRFNEELQQIREEKQQKLNSSQQTLMHDTSKNSALDGWVRDIHPNNRTVDIEVEIYDNGEEHVETYTLESPSTPEEYTVENELVRLLALFAERKHDVTSILERKVWIQKVEGEYKLHVPDSIGFQSKCRARVERWAVKKGILSWSESTDTTPFVNGAQALFSGGLVALAGFMFLYTMNTIGLGLASMDILFSGMLVSLIIGFSLFLHLMIYEDSERTRYQACPRFILTALVICSLTVVTGIATLTEPSAISTDSTSTLGNAAHAAITFLSIALAAFYGYEPIRRGNEARKQFTRNILRRYRSWRGIEYIRDVE